MVLFHCMVRLGSVQVLQSAPWTMGRGDTCRPPPIPLVYNMANLIGVDPSMHSFVNDFVIDLAILQK